MFRLAIVLFLIVAPVAAYSDVPIRPGPVNVRVYDGNRPGIIFHKLDNTIEPMTLSPCFPYGCGNIKGPIVNPSPRKPEEMPACYYGIDDVLFYEREGAECPYVRPSNPNEARIERRKQEWLKRQPAE